MNVLIIALLVTLIILVIRVTSKLDLLPQRINVSSYTPGAREIAMEVSRYLGPVQLQFKPSPWCNGQIAAIPLERKGGLAADFKIEPTDKFDAEVLTNGPDNLSFHFKAKNGETIPTPWEFVLVYRGPDDHPRRRLFRATYDPSKQMDNCSTVELTLDTNVPINTQLDQR